MKKLILTGTLIAYLVGSTGCFHTSQQGGHRDQTQDEVKVAWKLHSIPEIEVKESNSIDGLLNDFEDLDNHLKESKPCEIYQPKIDSIETNLQEGNFENVGNIVKELAYALGNDDNKCAKTLLERIKNFTYIVVEYTSPKYETTKPSFLTRAVAVAWIIPAVVLSPIDSSKGEDNLAHMSKDVYNNTIKGKKITKEIESESYRIIEVSPYHGTQKVSDKLPEKLK